MYSTRKYISSSSSPRCLHIPTRGSFVSTRICNPLRGGGHAGFFWLSLNLKKVKYVVGIYPPNGWLLPLSITSTRRRSGYREILASDSVTHCSSAVDIYGTPEAKLFIVYWSVAEVPTSPSTSPSDTSVACVAPLIVDRKRHQDISQKRRRSQDEKKGRPTLILYYSII